jgi:hypothetical protein
MHGLCLQLRWQGLKSFSIATQGMLQRAFDLDAAEKELGREIEKIPTLTAA